MGERGCGKRRPGVYLRCDLGPGGIPFDSCLIDPPQLLPEGMNAQNLANKPQLYAVLAEDGETLVNHLIKWIGEEHYPFLPDILEEGLHQGFSFRINPAFPLDLLTPGLSKMLLVHPRAYNSLWQQQSVPQKECLKEIGTHMRTCIEDEEAEQPRKGRVSPRPMICYPPGRHSNRILPSTGRAVRSRPSPYARSVTRPMPIGPRTRTPPACCQPSSGSFPLAASTSSRATTRKGMKRSGRPPWRKSGRSGSRPRSSRLTNMARSILSNKG